MCVWYYIVGERERANLVVKLAQGFHMYPMMKFSPVYKMWDLQGPGTTPGTTHTLRAIHLSIHQSMYLLIIFQTTVSSQLKLLYKYM